METIIFDVMLGDKFVCQFVYKHCPAFKVNFDEVLEVLYTKRPSLRGKSVKLCETDKLLPK